MKHYWVILIIVFIAGAITEKYLGIVGRVVPE